MQKEITIINPYTYVGLDVANLDTKSFTFKVFNVVSEVFQVPVSSIKGTDRRRPIIDARHTVIYILKQYTNQHLIDIALNFNGKSPIMIDGKVVRCKNHATIIHSYNTAANLIETNPKYKQSINTVLRRLLLNQIK